MQRIQCRAAIVDVLLDAFQRQPKNGPGDILQPVSDGVFLSSIVPGRRPRKKLMSQIVIVLGVIAVWILLQAYILPKLGIST